MSESQHKTLWRLAGPIMVSNITVALLGIVDTAVVGHLEEPYYLGGITLATVVINFLYWGLSFLRMGTTGIIAQHFGAKNYNQIRSSFVQAMLLACMLGIFVLSIQNIISTVSFSILHGSPEVKLYANRYFEIVIWSMPAMLINLVLTGWLLGMQKAQSTSGFSCFYKPDKYCFRSNICCVVKIRCDWGSNCISHCTIFRCFIGCVFMP